MSTTRLWLVALATVLAATACSWLPNDGEETPDVPPLVIVDSTIPTTVVGGDGGQSTPTTVDGTQPAATQDDALGNAVVDGIDVSEVDRLLADLDDSMADMNADLGQQEGDVGG